MLWEQSQISFLISNYPIYGKLFCSKELNKSETSIRSKASKLGLKIDKKSEFFKDFQKRAANSKVGKKRPSHALLMKEYAKQGKLLVLTRERTEEDKIASSNRIKETIKKNGHPKGFLGHKHSKDVCDKMSSLSKDRWNDVNNVLNSQEHRQLLSDRQSKFMQNKMKPSSIYSKAKHGTIQIGSNIFFARSTWEANIGAYFEFLKNKNEIKEWKHEPTTFWFNEIKRGVRSYKPDFLITRNNDSEYYVEVKGYMDAKSKTKLFRMSKYYPNVEVDLIDKKRYEGISKMKGFIPNWGMLDDDNFIGKIRLCDEDGCGKKHHSQGLCRSHFYLIHKK
jgi:hypothetical protein